MLFSGYCIEPYWQFRCYIKPTSLPASFWESSSSFFSVLSCWWTVAASFFFFFFSFFLSFFVRERNPAGRRTAVELLTELQLREAERCLTGDASTEKVIEFTAEKHTQGTAVKDRSHCYLKHKEGTPAGHRECSATDKESSNVPKEVLLQKRQWGYCYKLQIWCSCKWQG